MRNPVLGIIRSLNNPPEMEMKRLVLILPTLLCTSCVFFEPRQVVKYDEDCDIHYRQYTVGIADNPGRGVVIREGRDNSILVSPDIYSALYSCGGGDCVRLLRDVMKVVAVDTLFASSVAIAGNTVQWLEKEKDCKEVKPSKKEIIEEDLGKIT